RDRVATARAGRPGASVDALRTGATREAAAHAARGGREQCAQLVVGEACDRRERVEAVLEEQLALPDVADPRERALVHEGHAERALVPRAEASQRFLRVEREVDGIGPEGTEQRVAI